MIHDQYTAQVELLLRVLPMVSEEQQFAMHGGTAINLFVHDLPRLSVDIDLTYIPLLSRDESLANINSALEELKNKIINAEPNFKVDSQSKECKLIITSEKAQIKVEVNYIKRGLLADVQNLVLCEKASKQFDTFVEARIVSNGELYGGKLCAGLDRQHPRDIFDIQHLMAGEGITDEVKKGLIYAMISSNRPIEEILNPNLSNQRAAMIKQFTGMSQAPFSYEDFEESRVAFISTLHRMFNDNDKQFLMSIKNLSPEWDLYDFQKYPSVQWKLLNLQKFKSNYSERYATQVSSLSLFLNSL